MDKKECITIINTSFGYKNNRDRQVILKDVNVNFFHADFVGIVGLNGIGKSTFLKSIAGVIPILAGNILIDQMKSVGYSFSEIAKKIAIVLTDKISGFNLTAYDLVASGRMPYTNSFHQLSKNDHSIIESAIEMLGIKADQNRVLNELSDGLFQKTIIAKAIAQQSSILLMDEPSAFLDFASKHNLFLLLKMLSEKENKCILVSSHDLDLLIKYCNKLLVISDNKVEIISISDSKKNAVFQKIAGGFI